MYKWTTANKQYTMYKPYNSTIVRNNAYVIVNI
jgi:hypothetical protein